MIGLVRGVGVGLLAVLTLTLTTMAQDKVDIPKKVMQVLKAKFPKAKITKATKEKEGGVVVYDIEFTQDGKKFEADIKEDGTIVNWEMEIPLKDLPAVVKKAVEKRYPKSTLKDAMQITAVKGKKEELEGYEINLVTAARKKVEVTVSPSGKILEDSGEEKKKKEKK